MATKPIIKPNLTPTDKFIEIIGWCAVVAIWIMTIIYYPELPDTIPIHFDYTGQADGFGGKEKILILPVTTTLLFALMTLLNKFPHIFNYPVEITETNALRQYTIATKLIRFLKLAIVVILGLIEFTSIQIANGQNGLGTLFLPFTIGFILLPLVYFVLKMYKAR